MQDKLCVIDIGHALVNAHEHFGMLQEYQVDRLDVVNHALEVWQRLISTDAELGFEYFSSEAQPWVEMKVNEMVHRHQIHPTPWVIHPLDNLEQCSFALLEGLETLCRNMDPYLRRLVQCMDGGVLYSIETRRLLGQSVVIALRYTDENNH